MSDPAAVLRAAADLAIKKALLAAKILPDRWSPADINEDDPELAEHIAAADPAFMLTVAAWWRWASDGSDSEIAAALPSALAYLRQDTDGNS